MPERTDQPQQQPTPTLTPRPNRILAEPATPENCAADIRDRLGWKDGA